MSGETPDALPLHPSLYRGMTDAALRLVTPRPSRSPEELNLRILQPLFRYVRRQFGDQALSRIAERAGIPIDFFDRASAWVSHGQFEAVLAATRALVKNCSTRSSSIRLAG